MENNIFTLIVPLVFITALIIGALVTIVKAIRSGSISYGYKYYKPHRTCKQEDNPVGFWLGVMLYFSGMVVSFFLAFFILHTSGTIILS